LPKMGEKLNGVGREKSGENWKGNVNKPPPKNKNWVLNFTLGDKMGGFVGPLGHFFHPSIRALHKFSFELFAVFLQIKNNPDENRFNLRH
jgi:hypothetical protein